ncbi:hypothetical protein BKA70DRAFT_1227277 [Coprinopsis sp. MPI-PUGE-AT-0042]|nr:hypothetical protein BKA70DRAFT_1227277 [Coprinopsis sp. MPI-PUGE-AT-0042]
MDDEGAGQRSGADGVGLVAQRCATAIHSVNDVLVKVSILIGMKEAMGLSAHSHWFKALYLSAYLMLGLGRGKAQRAYRSKYGRTQRTLLRRGLHVYPWLSSIVVTAYPFGACELSRDLGSESIQFNLKPSSYLRRLSYRIYSRHFYDSRPLVGSCRSSRTKYLSTHLSMATLAASRSCLALVMPIVRPPLDNAGSDGSQLSGYLAASCYITELESEGWRLVVEGEVSLLCVQDGSVGSMLMGLRQPEPRPDRMVDFGQPQCSKAFVEATAFPLAPLAERYTPSIGNWIRRLRRDGSNLRLDLGESSLESIARSTTTTKRQGVILSGYAHWANDSRQALQNRGRYASPLSSLPTPVVEIWMGSTRDASRPYRSRWFGLRLDSNCRIPGTSTSLKIPNRSKDRTNLHMREVSIRKPGIKKRRTGCPNYHLVDDSGSFTSYSCLTGSWETPSSVHHYLTDNSVNRCTSFGDTWYRNRLASDLALRPPSMPEWGVTMGEVTHVSSIIIFSSLATVFLC